MKSYLSRIAIAYLSTMKHRDALWIFQLRNVKVSKMTMKKQNTLHRFAAVAAVLLTLCLVFMMPVGAADTEWVEVSTLGELAVNLVDGKSVRLMSDITVDLPNSEASDMGYTNITIPSGVSATLNLNGHDISITDYTTQNYNFVFINVKGTLTVDDFSEEGSTGTISVVTTKERDSTNSVASYIFQVRDGGKLIINGGEYSISHATTVTNRCLMYAVTVFPGSELDVNGGKITSTYMVLRGFSSAVSPIKFTITDGEISGYHYGLILQQTSNSPSGITYDVDISGGKVHGEARGIYVFHTTTNPMSGSIDVTGGEISCSSTGSGAIYYKNPGSDTVESTFTMSSGVLTSISSGVINMENVNSWTPTKTITGGTFSSDVSEFVASGKVCVANDDGTFTVTDETHSISVSASSINFGTVTEGYSNSADNSDVPDVLVTVTNDGNSKVTLRQPLYDDTKFIVGSYSDTSAEINPGKKVTFAISPQGALEADTYTDDIIIQAIPVESGDNGVFEVYDEEVITVTFTVIEKPENEETAIVPTLPPIGVEENEDGDVIITVPEETVSKEVLEGTSYLEIKTGEDASVTLMISGYSGENGQYTLGSEAEIAATYTPAEPTLNPEYEESTVVLGVVLELEKVNATLPVFSFDYDEETAGKVTSTYVKPLAMLKATHNAEEADADLKSVSLIFVVDKELYEKYEGKFFLYHVADNGEPEEVSGVPTIDSTTYEEDGLVAIIFTSDLGFSSYVLAVGTDSDGETGGEAPGITSSGSATDTGSGNYQYYPRSVPTDGIVDFGTSKVVTGMELPAGSDGTVTLNIKPTFAMPENGFYAFEIDAPGYNLDAKINGGLSFQIPVADLEAAGWTAEDIVLFHGTVAEDGKITWEALPTNLVKNENGIAYYKAAINGCSPFYIGFVKDGSVVNTEVVDPVTPETPETPDEPEVLPPVDTPETPEQPTESPAPILAVLAGLGAAVVLRRK